MGKDDEARSEVELDLAEKLLELSLEPSLSNQILVLSMLYNTEESLVRESKKPENNTYHSRMVAQEAMLRWIYINRQMRKLGRLSAKSY